MDSHRGNALCVFVFVFVFLNINCSWVYEASKQRLLCLSQLAVVQSRRTYVSSIGQNDRNMVLILQNVSEISLISDF